MVKGGILNEIPVELGSLGSIRVNVSRREDDGTTWSLCGAHVSYRSYARPQRTTGWITKEDGIATIDCVDTESLGELRVSSPGNRTVVSRDVVVGPDETIEVGVIQEPSHSEPNSPE